MFAPGDTGERGSVGSPKPNRAPIVQRPRTPPFQGGNAGSNPVGSTQYSFKEDSFKEDSFKEVRKALWRSWLARRPVTAKVAGSSPVRVARSFGSLPAFPAR